MQIHAWEGERGGSHCPAFLWGLWSQKSLGRPEARERSQTLGEASGCHPLCRQLHTGTFSEQLSRLTSSALRPRGAGTWGRGLELSGARWEDEMKEVRVDTMSLVDEPGKGPSVLLLQLVGRNLD